MNLKSAIFENPKIKKYEDMISPISDYIIMILQSNDKFIGYYSNGEYYIDFGKDGTKIVTKENPVLFWEYLSDFTLIKYKCNCDHLNNSHFIGLYNCLYELVPEEENPQSVDGINYFIPSNKGLIQINRKKLFSELGYSLNHGYWQRLKSKDILKKDEINYKKYIDGI